jgi:hypothetical protein
MNKPLLFAILFLFLLPAVCFGANVDGPDYYSIVKQLKNDNLNVDYNALRISYTKTADYKPYGGDAPKQRSAAYDDLNNNNHAGAIKKAEALLEKNYIDMDAHFICRHAYKKLGDTAKYAFHNAILKGLINSLSSSGDGSSPEKALVVISVPEEYFFLRAKGLIKPKQKLANVNGKRYDKMEVEDKKTGEKKTLYFNIDIPFGWLAKNFEKK